MEKNPNRKTYQVFTAVTVIVALLGLGNSAYIIFNAHEVAPILSNVFAALALLGAMLYIFRGGRKSEAAFYSGFMFFLALTEFVSIVVGIGALQRVGNSHLSLTITILTLGFGIYIFLASAKDLGQAPTFLCGGLVFVLFLALFIVDLATASGDRPVSDMIRGGANVALSFVAIYLIAAKYKDKTARGTK